jgi:hypothetical protein
VLALAGSQELRLAPIGATLARDGQGRHGGRSDWRRCWRSGVPVLGAGISKLAGAPVDASIPTAESIGPMEACPHRDYGRRRASGAGGALTHGALGAAAPAAIAGTGMAATRAMADRMTRNNASALAQAILALAGGKAPAAAPGPNLAPHTNALAAVLASQAARQ